MHAQAHSPLWQIIPTIMDWYRIKENGCQNPWTLKTDSSVLILSKEGAERDANAAAAAAAPSPHSNCRQYQ
jgi:hypothetical protein